MKRRLALPVAAGVLLASAAASRAQVTADSSLGTSVMMPNATTFEITGGTRPAGAPTNLFHSFGTFSVANGVTANFMNSGAATDNIVARVTGGSSSDIFGTVQTTGFGQANLFFLNPAGFMFGGNAQLNVDGSFTASTADYVVLSNGWRLDAAAGAPTFTVAGPTRFGFLDSSVEAIDVSALNAPLAVDAGKSLSLVGGRIGVTTGPLAAPSGRIDLASVASPGVVSLDAGIGMSGFTTLANIAVTNSTLNVDGVVTDAANSNGGEVFIRGGQFVVDHSTVTSATVGTSAGGSYDIDVGMLDVGYSTIATSTSGSGNSGGIAISADTIDVHHQSSITGNALDSGFIDGNGGQLTFHDIGTLTVDDSTIASNTNESGEAGTVTFSNVGTLTVTNNSRVSSDSIIGTSGAAFAGNGGTVELTGVGNLQLSGGGTISASSNSSSAAGEIVVNVLNTVDVGAGSRILVNADGGNAGGLRLSAETLNVSGSVTATTAGDSGTGTNNFVIDAATINVYTGGEISAISSGTATAGNIELRNVDTLTVAGGSIRTDTQLLLNATLGHGLGGNAGTITATVNNLTLSGGGRISSSTQGFGNGGIITINAADEIAISGATSGIFTTTSGIAALNNGRVLTGGTGGSVVLNAKQLDVSAGRIDVSTTGAGHGGNITIGGGDIRVHDHGFITGNTFNTGFINGDGGELAFHDISVLTVDNATIATNTHEGGKAGKLTFNNIGTVTVINDGSIASNSIVGTSGAAFAGNGGTVELTGVGNLQLSGGGTISASSNSSSAAGEIVVNVLNTVDVGAGSRILVNADGGNAGGLRLSAETLNVSGSVTATTAGDSGAGTNNFVIDAATINVNSGGDISAISSGTATAGNIELRNVDTLTVAGGSIRTDTQLLLNATLGDGLGGNAGTITATVNNLTLSGGGRISSSTQGFGQGGTVTIGASGTIAISGTDSGIFTTTGAGSAVNAGRVLNGGDGGDVALTAQRLDVSGGSVDASTRGAGRGGIIDIGAGTVNLNASGEVSATSSGTGTAGDIELHDIGTLTVAGGSVRTDTLLPLDQGLGGDAGDVTANVGTLSISSGGRISSSTQGSGQGGTIDIEASGPLTITDAESGVFTTTNAGSVLNAGGIVEGGSGGDIDLGAARVQLDRGASVSSSSFGVGDAGAISIRAADSIEILAGSFVRTTAEQSSGGNISIEAANLLYLLDSEITTEAGGATLGDNGGDIDIDPSFVVLNGSNVIARANGGNGGNIFITAGTFIKDPSSVVNADSQQQTDGEIVIESPIQDVTAAVTILDPSFLDASRLLRERCSAAATGERSAFTLAGRGGVRRAPDDYFVSNFQDVAPPSGQTGSAQTERDVVARNSIVLGPIDVALCVAESREEQQ